MEMKTQHEEQVFLDDLKLYDDMADEADLDFCEK